MNQTLKLDVGRQEPLFGEISFDFSHIADNAVAVNAIDLPYGAQVIGGSVIVDTAFNPGTSLVLDVGDAISGNRYVNDVNLAATGRTPLVPTGYVSTGGAVTITPTLVGAAATQGAARLNLQYVIKGRAGQVQP